MTSDVNDRGPETTRRTALVGGAALALAGAAGGAGAQPAKGEEIIDIHAHIISSDAQKYPPSPFGGNQSDWSRQRPLTFDQLIQEMDAAGVAKAAMVQVSTFYGSNDSYLADSVARFPKRFTGVCSIDTLAPDNVAVLEGWMKRGMTGLRIFTGGNNTAMLVDPKAFPIWEFASDKALPICVETSQAGLANTAFLLKRYPRVKVILDHCAHPLLDDGAPYAKAQAFMELAQYRNLYLKITPLVVQWSGQGKSTPADFFGTLVRTFGADHMAWGSNIPSSAPPMTKLVADTRAGLASLSPADRAMVLAGTAKRLYPVLA
jgi:predicted TIM-barrel fold metal-dependent hydrolase